MVAGLQIILLALLKVTQEVSFGKNIFHGVFIKEFVKIAILAQDTWKGKEKW